MASESPVQLEYRGKVAIITLNAPKKLNALDGTAYYKLALAMQEIAKRDDIYITVLTGKGRYFSAGADVSFGRTKDPTAVDEQQTFLRGFVSQNLFVRVFSYNFFYLFGISTIFVFGRCKVIGIACAAPYYIYTLTNAHRSHKPFTHTPKFSSRRSTAPPSVSRLP